MRRLAVVLLLAFADGGCDGCRRNRNVDESDGASRSSWKARFAAHALGATAVLARLEDGCLVLSSGVFIHLIRHDGSITMLGGPSAYAPFVSESDEEISGFDVTPRRDVVVSGSCGRLFVQSAAPQQTFVWDGQRWSKTQETPPLATSPLLAFQPVFGARVPDATALPLTHAWPRYVDFADGRHAWLGDSDDRQELFVEGKATGGVVVPLPKLPGEGSQRCVFVESADDHLYAYCTGYRVGDRSTGSCASKGRRGSTCRSLARA